MTDFERSLINNDIQERINQVEQQVVDGVVSEWNAAADRVYKALKQVELEKAAEVRRWDADKLAAEMQAVSMLVDYAVATRGLDNDSEKVLTRIYDDAVNSGDIYKKRAAAEVFSGLMGKKIGDDMDSRMKANRFITRAKNDAEECRTTDGIKRAEEEARSVMTESHLVSAEQDYQYQKNMESIVRNNEYQILSKFWKDVRRNLAR